MTEALKINHGKELIRWKFQWNSSTVGISMRRTWGSKVLTGKELLSNNGRVDRLPNEDRSSGSKHMDIILISAGAAWMAIMATVLGSFPFWYGKEILKLKHSSALTIQGWWHNFCIRASFILFRKALFRLFRPSVGIITEWKAMYSFVSL